MGIILASSLEDGKSVTEYVIKHMFESEGWVRDEEGDDEDSEWRRINTVIDWCEEVPGILWIYTRNWVQWGNEKQGFFPYLHCMVYAEDLNLSGKRIAHYELYNLGNAPSWNELSYRVLSKYAQDEYTVWDRDLRDAMLIKLVRFVEKNMNK